MRQLLLLALPIALAACTPSDRSNDSPGMSSDSAVSSTEAELATSTRPTPAVVTTGAANVALVATAGNSASGSLTLATEGGGVRITGELAGLAAAGEHGFHIHENGDCSAADASSAGGHFNPTAMPHGRPDSGQHHAGDMYNIVADAEGKARVDSLAMGVVIGGGGSTDVTGKAIVLHTKGDDYTSQPAGDSGDRIACGVIR